MEEPITRPASASSRWLCSARLRSVTSSITLMAMTTAPSSARIGVAFTRFQRSVPSRVSTERITASASSSPASASRPGSRSGGNGSPSSSYISKRSRTSSVGVRVSSSTDA